MRSESLFYFQINPLLTKMRFYECNLTDGQKDDRESVVPAKERKPNLGQVGHLGKVAWFGAAHALTVKRLQPKGTNEESNQFCHINVHSRGGALPSAFFAWCGGDGSGCVCMCWTRCVDDFSSNSTA